MAADVFPPAAGGTTSLTPFTGPVLTVPSAINQIAPTAWSAPGPYPHSTFVTNNALYGGNSYATATLHLRAGGVGAVGAAVTIWGSDDAQANWTPLAGVNALTGITEALLVMPPNSTAMWYIPVAGLSVIQARVVSLTSGGFFAAWTGSAAGIISPAPPPPTLAPVSKQDWSMVVSEQVPGNNVTIMAPHSTVTSVSASTRTTTSASSYPVPAAQRLRIHSWAGNFLAGAGGGRCLVGLRSNLAGATAIGSNLLGAWSFGPSAGGVAPDERWSGLSSSFPEPIDIYNNGTGASVGISAMGSAGSNGKLTFTLWGYLIPI